MSATATHELITRAADQLARAGVASPRHDAEVLAAHVLGVPRGRLALLDAADVEPARGEFEAAVGRRAAREPLQHVIGTAPFRRLELVVGRGVLIPRPETELLVDAALRWLRDERLTKPRIVDLGTGTGAIALALADEYPGARIWAVEREIEACAFAVRNVAATGLAVELVRGDMADALPALDARIDLVMANPPYLPLDALTTLEPEVRDFDPAAALCAGPDALAAIHTVEATSRRLLRCGGLAIVEHGMDQAETAPASFGAGWTSVDDHLDLSGRPRYLTAVRA